MVDKSGLIVLQKDPTELKEAKVDLEEETEEALEEEIVEALEEETVVLVIKETQQWIWVWTIRMQRRELSEASKVKR